MKLYLVRHTTAADSAVNDAQRPLTPVGEEEARVVGMALAGMSIRPSMVFSSPLLRAQQTAGIICRQLSFAGDTTTLRELDNGHSTAALLSALRGGEIVAVGHMPSLAEHVATITGAPGIVFGKGSVACIDDNGLVWLKHLAELKELVI